CAPPQTERDQFPGCFPRTAAGFAGGILPSPTTTPPQRMKNPAAKQCPAAGLKTLQSALPLRQLDIRIDDVFQQFLPAADGGRDFPLLEHVLLERSEALLAGFDARADACAPRAVALGQHLIEEPVLANRRGNLQPASKRVHAADVG